MKIDDITHQVSGGATIRSIIEGSLKRAEDAEKYHALLSLTSERALQRADELDAIIAEGGSVGRLFGVPFVVKDNFLAFGAPTTAASIMLKNFDAPLQSTAVEKLEAEGAICIGKANLDAFANGGSTENSAFGPTKNAIDVTKVAGGSSGGSAVVTALDIVPFALGTDTGGSIRQPASFNGVLGIKPTYGAVSRYGVVAMASSTDTIGCFATTARDAEIVMDAMAGQDENDMTTIVDFFAIESQKVTPKKIGLIREFMSNDVDRDVREAISVYADQLRANGHTVEEVSLPSVDYSIPAYYIIVPAEISSNLARYDGIRYGHRSKDFLTLAELYGRTRGEGFVTENKRRIMIGSYVLSSGYFDAFYLQAQKARTLIINSFNELFSSYDFLLGPTAPTPAFDIGKKSNDPVSMYLADAMTVSSSLAGLPALSTPAGLSSDGLPIGAQLIGPQKSDARLLALVKSMEDIYG